MVHGILCINSDTVSLTAEVQKSQVFSIFSKTEQVLLPLNLMVNVLLNIRKKLNNSFYLGLYTVYITSAECNFLQISKHLNFG